MDDVRRDAESPVLSHRISSRPPDISEPSSKRACMNPSSSKGMDSNITLWQFLLELLVSHQKDHIIRWTNNDGEFKLLNAEEVARLWGLRKNKNNMNYDKLSRALRYYYDKNIIRKVMGQKFVYKFVSFPEVVKTENKIPFKTKMESMAKEYRDGLRVFPHFASYNPVEIKSSAEIATYHIKTEVTAADSTIPSPVQMMFAHTESSSSCSTSVSSSSSPQRKRFKAKLEPTHSDEVTSTQSCSSSKITSSSSNTTSIPLYTDTAVTVTSSVGSSKPKPNPLKLSMAESSLPNTLTLPVPSPKFTSAFPTPIVLSSPALRTPGTPLLHFWSTLSPVTTMSPRFGSSNSAFQFPTFATSHVAIPPIAFSNFSNVESLATPALTSPTPTIPCVL